MHYDVCVCVCVRVFVVGLVFRLLLRMAAATYYYFEYVCTSVCMYSLADFCSVLMLCCRPTCPAVTVGTAAFVIHHITLLCGMHVCKRTCWECDLILFVTL